MHICFINKKYSEVEKHNINFEEEEKYDIDYKKGIDVNSQEDINAFINTHNRLYSEVLEIYQQTQDSAKCIELMFSLGIGTERLITFLLDSSSLSYKDHIIQKLTILRNQDLDFLYRY